MSAQAEYGEDACRARLALVERWIAQAARICREAAAGNLESRLLHIDVDGDLGAMLHAINHLLDQTDAFAREATTALRYAGEEKFYRRFLLHGMRGSFQRGAEQINRVMEQMAGKTRSLREAEQQRLSLADEFEQAVKGVVDRVVESAGQMADTAGELARIAEQTRDDSARVAGASQEVSRHVDTVAEAAGNVAAATAHIEQQVVRSDGTARQAQTEVARTRETIGQLEQASRQIGRVVKLIGQVASQTRLLSLNATVEAARAGEFGRGFAVVAAEVKGLAGQTTEATEEIAEHVQAIVQATANAVAATGTIGQTVQEIGASFAAIRAAVDGQRHATAAMSGGIQEAAGNTREVAGSISSVSEATQQTCEVAAVLREAAGGLCALADGLQAEVERFLLGIRGAPSRAAHAPLVHGSTQATPISPRPVPLGRE